MLALLVLMPPQVLSQTLMFGVKGGLGTISPVSSEAPYDRSTYPHDVGPVIETALPRNFALEASALRKRVSYRQTVTTVAPRPGVSRETTLSETGARAWEIPVVVKKYVPVTTHTRVYGNIGFSIRRMSGTTDFVTFRNLIRPFPGPPGPPPTEVVSGHIDPPDMIRKWSGGLVIGGGVEFKIGLVRLQPEMRYTRWANEPFRSADANLRSSRNSLDVLLGFTVSP